MFNLLKKFSLTILANIFLIKYTIADEGSGILGDFQGEETTKAIRRGDIHVEDIPVIITNVIDFLLGIAGTVAIIFIIIGAYQILFGSLSQDNTKGKNTIIMAIGGFVIATLAWFIIKLIIDNLT